MSVQFYVNKVIDEALKKYPSAEEITVSFYHDKSGRGPFIDNFKILTDKTIYDDYDLAEKLECVLDEIRVYGFGYHFFINVEDREVY